MSGLMRQCIRVYNNEDVEEATRYHKVYNPFKRSEDGKRVLPGVWARDEFEVLQSSKWTGTEKMDGTNIRITWVPRSFLAPDDQIHINGRKANSQISKDLDAVLHRLFVDRDRWMAAFKGVEEFDGCVTLYGEGIGPGIQKGGGLYSPNKDFCLFDVRVGRLWLKQDDVTEVAEKMEIHRAPVLGVATLVEWMRIAQHGFETRFPGAKPNKQAEGVMVRPVGNFLTRLGERIICKVKTAQLQHEGIDEWLNGTPE